MKNKKWIIFWIALGVFVVGAVIALISLANVGFDWAKMNTSEPRIEVRKEMDIEGIQSIVLKDSNNEIDIYPSTDDKIHLTFFENNKEKYEIDVQNGELSVRYTHNRKWYEWIGINTDFVQKKLTLEIPAAYLGSLSAKNSNGLIQVKDIILDGSLTLKTSNGKVHASDVVIGKEIDLKTSNGVVELFDAKAASVKLDTSNGAIEAKRIEATGTIEADTSNGALRLEDLLAKEIRAKGSNTALNVSAIAADTINLKTSNGDIRGTITGDMSDYKIHSKSSLGDNNLPSDKTDGTKSLTVDTSLGSINIQFVK